MTNRSKNCLVILSVLLLVALQSLSFRVRGFYVEPDKSFGVEGMLRTTLKIDSPTNPAFFIEARVQKDGKVVTCGYIAPGQTNIVNFIIARFNNDGTPDKEFGDDGYVRLRNLVGGGARNELCERIELEGDKIVFAGRVTAGFGSGGDYDLLIGRLNPDGSFDTSFAQFGYTFYDLNRSNETIVSFMLDSSKYTLGLLPGDVNMVRFNHDGSLDTSFGVNGAFNYQFFERYVELGRTFGVAPRTYFIGKDGKYYVSISSGEEDEKLYILRVDKSGTLDNTFDSKGYKELPSHFVHQNVQNQTAVNKKGEIFIFSDIYQDNLIPKITVAKTTINGDIDTNFGTGGNLVTKFIDNPSTRRYSLATIKACSNGEGRYAAVSNDNMVFRADTLFSIIDLDNLAKGVVPQSTFYADINPKNSGMNVVSCFFHEGNYYMVSPESVTKVLVYNQVILDKTMRAYSKNIDVTYPSGKGVIGNTEIVIKKDSEPFLQIFDEANTDLYLASLSVNSNTDSLLVEKFDLEMKKSVLIRYQENIKSIMLCPEATQLSGIRKYCAKMKLIVPSSLDVKEIEGSQYWVVPFTEKNIGVQVVKNSVVKEFSGEVLFASVLLVLTVIGLRKRNSTLRD